MYVTYTVWQSDNNWHKLLHLVYNRSHIALKTIELILDIKDHIPQIKYTLLGSNLQT